MLPYAKTEIFLSYKITIKLEYYRLVDVFQHKVEDNSSHLIDVQMSQTRQETENHQMPLILWVNLFYNNIVYN
jgi:hypothetical protein